MEYYHFSTYSWYNDSYDQFFSMSYVKMCLHAPEWTLTIECINMNMTFLTS